MRPVQFFIALALVCTLPVASHAQGTYTCAHFQFFGPTNIYGNTIPFAGALNDSDLIVGEFVYYQSEYGFYSQAGTTFQPFLVKGSSSADLSGVNNAGEAVGSYYISSGSSEGWHGFETASGSTPTPINYPASEQTWATGINNQNQIVGYYVPKNEPVTGFTLSNGKYTTLQVEGASETLPTAVNDSGTIVGWWDSPFSSYPFIYIDGNYTLPAAPSTAGETFFTAINNQGQIAGNYLDADVIPTAFVGFVYVDGVYNIVSIPNAKWVELRGINNHGDITGTIMTEAGDQPAFLGTSCHF
jgi:hypothetical protein